MYKFLSLLVLVALTAFVSAEEMEVQDQEAAEQYMLTHGVWPSWYSGLNGLSTVGGLRIAGLRTLGGISTINGINTIGGIRTLGGLSAINGITTLGGVRTISTLPLTSAMIL